MNCILHLISLSFKQVEAKLEGLRPRNIVMPADPHNQTEEWRQNMAAQVRIPNEIASFTILGCGTRSVSIGNRR